MINLRALSWPGRIAGVLVLLVLGAGVVLGARAMYRGLFGDVPATEGPTRVVPDREIERDRPKPLTPVGRIFRRRVPPRVQVSEGRPDSSRIRRFARLVREDDSLRQKIAQLRRDSVAGDTTARPSRVRLPTPILPPSWGRYDGRTFAWSITRSDGSLLRATARVRGRVEFFAGLDQGSDTVPAITGDRFFTRVTRETPGCAVRSVPAAVGGVLVDRNDLRGGLVGLGGALLACLAK